jgi:hypothetical protein
MTTPTHSHKAWTDKGGHVRANKETDADRLIEQLQANLPGLLPMPLNGTDVRGFDGVGDSCFHGRGINAVAFSGFASAHRIGADLGLNPWALAD